VADVESITVEILKQIRDEIRTTREDLGGRIDQTNQRLDQTNQRLDQTNQRLDHVEGTLVELATQNAFLVRHAKRVSARDKRFQGELDELRKRVDDIEERLPPKTS
jgi:chromosome segregation ATPase